MNKFRLPALFALLLLIFCCTRLMVRALPGDPLETLVSETGTRVPKKTIELDLHLHQSPAHAVATDLIRAMHGDLGHSVLSGEPVAPTVGARTLKTLQLATLATLIALAASLILGLGSVYESRPLVRKTLNAACTLHGTLALSLPSPWLGPAVLYLFAVAIPVFPVGKSLILPAFTLAFGLSGVWARLIRERVSATLHEPSVQSARARGISEFKVLLKYGLAPASPALLAYFGTQVGFLLGGVFVIEVIFDWPGLGLLMVDSVLRRDYPLVEASVFAAAAFSLLGTYVGDWLQSRADPRERAL